MNQRPLLQNLLLAISLLVCFSNVNILICSPPQIEEALIEQGFENIAIHEDISQVVVTYENRIYRYEVHALQEAIQIVRAYISRKNIVIIIQHKGIPITAIIGQYNNIGDYSWNATFNVGPYWNMLKHKEKKSLSFHKLDIVLYPQIKAQFGNYDDPVESQLNLAPALETTLWQGASLMLQWIIPLQNELDNEGDQSRPGLLTLKQELRLPYNIFASATTGYFTQHRYGLDIEILKLWANGRWMLSGNVGYTGHACYLDKTWYYSNLDRWTWFLSGAYRFMNLDFTIQTTYGQFLYGDKGWRLDFSRQFGEVNVGFFVLKTEDGRNGGFNFSIPIFPMRRLKSYWIRISPEAYFPYEYRYRGLPNCGRRHKTGNQLDNFYKTWKASVIIDQSNSNLK